MYVECDDILFKRAKLNVQKAIQNVMFQYINITYALQHTYKNVSVTE